MLSVGEYPHDGLRPIEDGIGWFRGTLFNMNGQPLKKIRWSIVELLKPHSKALAFGFLAVIGGSIAGLLIRGP